MSDVQQLCDYKNNTTLAMKKVYKGIAENDEDPIKQYVSELKVVYQTIERIQEVQCLARDVIGIKTNM